MTVTLTPERFRWVMCEVAIASLTRLADSGVQLDKTLQRWFPDADQETIAALHRQAVVHLEAHASWLRRHSDRQIAAGQYREGSYPS